MLPRSFLGILALLAFFAPALSHAQDGIYADFVTGRGSFTAKLHYTLAPRTVANFIGLATGSRPWLDLNTGSVERRPFYNGLTFHRAISGFVIQSGSRNGQGTDGPGYSFRDEFVPSLRHSAAGILSMANSGSHSNGSQFFITLAATPALNDVHSVFGEIVAGPFGSAGQGRAVATTIGNGATGPDGRPSNPVTLQSVTIRRVGAAAQAFDEKAQPLPVVGGANPTIRRQGAGTFLNFARGLNNDFRFYYSTDLTTWFGQKIGFWVRQSDIPQGDLGVTSTTTGRSKVFYRIPQIAYPDNLYTAASPLNKTLEMTVSNGSAVFHLRMIFNSDGSGTFEEVNVATGAFTAAGLSWTQDPYRGVLLIVPTGVHERFSQGYPYYLSFTSLTEGTVRTSFEEVINSQRVLYSCQGTFTLQ